MTSVTTKIGEVLHLVGGRKPQLHRLPKAGYLPFLSAKVLRGTEMPEYGDPKDKNSVLARADDLVMICTGSNSGEVFTGKIGLVASTMARIDVSPSINQSYVRYFLQMHFHLLNGAMKGMTIPSLDRQLFNALTIPVPTLDEQQRIVRRLDEAVERIDIAKANAEANLQSARAIFESHLHATFERGNDAWQEMQLGQICQVEWGNGDLTKSAFVENGEFLAVSAAGADGRIGHKEHEKFTPVLSAIGAQCGRMFLPDEDFTAIKNTITLTPRNGTCTGKFLYRLLSYVELPKRGTAQPFISKGDIQSFLVHVPPADVQERIVDLLENIERATDELMQAYKAKIIALDDLKRSILGEAFSGELTVAS